MSETSEYEFAKSIIFGTFPAVTAPRGPCRRRYASVKDIEVTNMTKSAYNIC